MKKFNAVIIGTALLIICSCTQNVDLEAEKTNVNALLDQTIQMMETEDAELLSKVYAQDSDMVSFGTEGGERIVGWEKLKELMQKQFDTTENSKLSIKDRTVKVHNSGKVAWFSEIIDWSLMADSQEVKLEGLRGTGVCEKRNENWVIVQIHYSVPAVTQAEEE